MCWALATLYWTLGVSREHPRGGGGNRATGTMALNSPAAESGEQPTLEAVSPAQKRESKTRSVQLVSDEKSAPSEQEEEAGPEKIT